MQTFNWVIEFDNGNQMGGGLNCMTFEQARKEVEKIVKDITNTLGYKCVEFTIKSGKLTIRHIPEV
jgi:hypothetical protein